MPRVIDLREAIPDLGFNDISHMNRIGRERTTDMIYEHIQHEL